MSVTLSWFEWDEPEKQRNAATEKVANALTFGTGKSLRQIYSGLKLFKVASKEASVGILSPFFRTSEHPRSKDGVRSSIRNNGTRVKLLAGEGRQDSCNTRKVDLGYYLAGDQLGAPRSVGTKEAIGNI